MIIRFDENPLIVPDSSIPWMSENAFNPGVVRDDSVFHMLIRGGMDRRHYIYSGLCQVFRFCYSDLGYASSSDGVHWDVHHSIAINHLDYGPTTENGIEDPRIVKWNNTFYIFATACHRYYGRLGIWRTQDFRKYDFLGTPFDWDDKNASIIPEKIDKKIYLIHRILPNIWISETQNEELTGPWINHQILLKASDVMLDGNHPNKIGLNGPPTKFQGNWFVLFHAKFEPFEYRTSFMILDGEDPHTIKYIHDKSILKPELYYEKYGAVPYTCFNTGIVDMDDRWYLYWGGADTVICGGYLLKTRITDLLKKNPDNKKRKRKG